MLNLFKQSKTNLSEIKHKILIFLKSEVIPLKEPNIVNVKKKENKNNIYIYITCLYPKVLIGSNGEIIHRINEYFNQCFNKNVEVFIYESKLWDITK